MKHMRKLLVVAFALAVCMAMSATAFAADPPTKGSITVKTNFKDQTYTLYKLFDAHITFKDDGTQRAITYTLPSGKTLSAPATDWYEVNSNGFIEAKDALTDAVMKSAAYRTWAKSFGTQVGDALTAASNNDTSIKWEQIDFGYYYVDSTLGAFITVDSDNPDKEVNDKNNPPSVDKEITGVENSTATLGVGDKTTDPGQGANEKAIAQVGDSIGYKLTVAAKPGAEDYVVEDTLSAGLTPPAATAVTVSCTSPAIAASDYTVTVTGQVIKVVFKQTWLDKITAATNITIEYDAVLNSSAVIGADGNENDVKLTWGHSPSTDVNYSEDEAKVYTAQISATKQDDSNQPLEGAGFVVQNKADNKYYKLDSNGNVTWVTNIGDADEHLSGADGAVAPFTGLKNGTYVLVEKTVPNGYNKLTDQEFTIADKDYTNTNLKQSATVTNEAGSTLPTTGGMGTTLFYVLGALLVVGCAILLVARRRTNNNK